jgi:hypothetical protein
MVVIPSGGAKRWSREIAIVSPKASLGRDAAKTRRRRTHRKPQKDTETSKAVAVFLCPSEFFSAFCVSLLLERSPVDRPVGEDDRDSLRRYAPQGRFSTAPLMRLRSE